MHLRRLLLGLGVVLWTVDLHAQTAVMIRSPSSVPTAQRWLPASSLAIETSQGWRVWWSAEHAPRRWLTSDTILRSAIPLRGRVLAWNEAIIAGSGEAWRTRLVVVRLDARSVQLQLDTASENRHPAWRLDRVPDDAIFAVNAGQFGSQYPWGLVLLEGHQYLAPGAGSLVTTIAIDSIGRLRWASGDSSARVAQGARWAFQSYPTLLRDGEVPAALQSEDGGIDVGHRDARLAMGLLDDGSLIFVMTRFDALGSALGFVPFGLTVPEMAATMGALGAREAVLLDGGVSAQMLLRDDAGRTHRWRGLRAVPLALVGRFKR